MEHEEEKVEDYQDGIRFPSKIPW